MMMYKNRESPEDVARRLLKPKPSLHPQIFDENAEMYEDLRLKILKKTEFFFNKAFQYIGGFVIDDIVLVGSCACYMYKEKSDLDVVIKVKNVSNMVFPTDSIKLEKACTYIGTGAFDSYSKFYVNGRYMDIKIDSTIYNLVGEYSILHNRWLKKPNKDDVCGILYDDLIERYYAKVKEIDDYMNQFECVDGKYTTQDAEKMVQYYTDLFKVYIADVKNYLIFKMLSSQGIIKRLGTYAMDQNIKSYSI